MKLPICSSTRRGISAWAGQEIWLHLRNVRWNCLNTTGSGDLASALGDIADHATLAADVRGRFRRALSYPVTAAALILGLLFVVLPFTLPRTWELGADLRIGPGLVSIGGSIGVLVLFLGGGVILLGGAPLLIYACRKPHWVDTVDSND